MNHMRDIKEMLSIPTGSSRNVATSGYSSFTDSQIFFGSQFWPENSQGNSQDTSSLSRMSQQSSQEGSDPKFSNSYHTKPLLFGEFKDKTKQSKAFGLLDKFEDDKKRAKEKADSDILAKEFHQFQETLNSIQQLLPSSDRDNAMCQTVIEKYDEFASTLQSNLSGLQRDISQQFETLLNKVNSQKEMMTELEERLQKSGDATSELGSSLQSLKNSLESLREEHEREQKMLEEALKLLSTLVSEHPAKPGAEAVTDSAIQTSPELKQPLSNILEDEKLEGTLLTCMSHEPERNQAQAPAQHPSCVIGKRKFTPRHRSRRKRPLVLSQRSKHAVSDENRQPNVDRSKRQSVSSPLCERRNPSVVTSQDGLNPDCLRPLNREMKSVAAGCLITPLSCWSQDSGSSVCPGVEPMLDKLPAEPRTESPVKPEGLWHLFDIDSD